jgi:hypothetical protein
MCRACASALGCRSVFFIGHPQLFQRKKYRVLPYAQTLRAFVLIGIRIGKNVLPQDFKIDFAVAEPWRLAMHMPDPAHHAGHSNAKLRRYFGNRKAFLLSDRQNLTAKIQRICHPSIIIKINWFGYNSEYAFGICGASIKLSGLKPIISYFGASACSVLRSGTSPPAGFSGRMHT